jgi:probable HAF family extracellular repeat protein
MGMVDLGTLGGDASEAYGVNNAGQVVGAADDENGDWYAFIWEDEQMNPLGALNDEGTHNEAQAVNEAGMIAGVSSVEFATNRAALWTDGTPANLGTLGGDDSEAFGLNGAGQVVGASGTGDGRLSAFIWLPTAAYGLPAGMSDLTPDANQAQVYGINNNGQAVGSGVYDTYSGAILWEAGTTYHLDDLIDPNSGWHLNNAQDINDAGQIVGIGTFNGQPRAFLLVPADPDPDPSLPLRLYLPAIVR